MIRIEIGRTVTQLTSELREAFDLLGVSPDADSATIRSAWKALVRAYHPDQFAGNKAEANRRLAQINAAFQLTSDWSPEDARADKEASAKEHAARDFATKMQRRQAAATRQAAE